jgi:tetratricopeptide (TPR) repeat protein
VTISEVLRLIKEEEPPRPSARLTGSGERLPTISAQRKTEPAKLVKLLRSDLDWIVLKALEKDRTRRYETAVGFAKDVQRYLADEPVEACPPSASYLLRKFARRHRTMLTVAAGFTAMLLLGIIGLVIGIVEVNSARVKTQRALESETLAVKQTRAALDTSEAVIQGMIRSRTQLDDSEKMHLSEVLNEYLRLPAISEDTPEARALTAETHLRVANLRLLLRDFAEAEASYTQAIQRYEQLKDEFSDVVEYRVILARNYFNLGILLSASENRLGATAAYQQALELHKGLADQFPEQSIYRRDQADDLTNLGAVLGDLREFVKAEASDREAIRLGEALVKEAKRDETFQINLTASYHNLANVLRDQGQLADALKEYYKEIDLLTPLVKREQPVARAELYLRNAYWDRANTLGQLGRHADAFKDWQQAIDLIPDRRASLRKFQKTAEVEVALQPVKPDDPRWPGLYYGSALFYVQAAESAALEREQSLLKQYTDRAMELLRDARKAGWFKDPRQVKELDGREFGVLRDRADFQKFLAELKPDAAK